MHVDHKRTDAAKARTQALKRARSAKRASAWLFLNVAFGDAPAPRMAR